MLVGEVGEPPDVTQTHGIADHGEHVLPLTAPVAPLHVLIPAAHVRVCLLCPMDGLLKGPKTAGDTQESDETQTAVKTIRLI